jgi:hypothetical protein
MPQARRTRRTTKHRGNAAGVIESRGRTGRKPTAAEKGGKAGQAARAREARVDRRDRPPTWRSAFYRAMVAAVILLLIALLLLKNPTTAIIYFPLALLLYTPMSYYVDLGMYRRRQRKRLQPGSQRKQAPR